MNRKLLVVMILGWSSAGLIAAEPAASLGRPMALPATAAQATLPAAPHFVPPPPPSRPAVIRAQVDDFPPPPPPFTPPSYDDPPVLPPPPMAPTTSAWSPAPAASDPNPPITPAAETRKTSKSYYEQAREFHRAYLGERLSDLTSPCEPIKTKRGLFESDHEFDYIASPLTNPFLFEDPRALTEVRGIFFLQKIPSSNPVFRGGNTEYFGAQVRVAVTDRMSVTINKLGGIAVNPGSDSGIDGGLGFAEVHVGPKFTFLRSTETKTVASAGVLFQIPVGSERTFQDTGKLSVVPYVTVAHNFLNSALGSLNILDTFGYSFRTDGERSDYFYNSFGLQWNVGDRNRIYPMAELHWFHYNQSGTARTFGMEGRDLANLGSTDVAGRNSISLAAGVRYKITERAQIGLAAEFPITGARDLLDYRVGLDFIWRY